MAVGALRVLGADVAVGATGVGGPEPSEGCPAGTVFVAVATARGHRVREYHFDGDPPQVVRAAAARALADLYECWPLVPRPCRPTGAEWHGGPAGSTRSGA